MYQDLTQVVEGAELKDKPWKYIGYKDLASYMASDPDFFAVRRFDRLHTRAILTLQARLENYEEKLDRLDQTYASPETKAVGRKPPEIIKVPSNGLSVDEKTRLDEKHGKYAVPRDINNATVRDDMVERTRLIDEYILLLEKYDRLLLDYSRLRAQKAAPSWNVTNVRNWFKNNRGAIMPNESRFPDHEEELLSVSAERGTFARRFFQNSVLYPIGRSTNLFTKQPRFMTSRDARHIRIFSDEAMETVVTASLFVTAILMLITPLWILQAIQSMQLKLGVITIFIVVFLGFLTYCTTGRAFERLAATAG
ncbi:Zn2/Cys6 DNA-binding protein [Apiospora arundinis]